MMDSSYSPLDSTATVYFPTPDIQQPRQIQFVPVLPETGVRPWEGDSVNVQRMDVPIGPKKARSWQTLKTGSSAEVSKSPQTAPLDGWSRHVHPSGRVYMYHEGERVVMEGGTELLTGYFGATPVANLWAFAARTLWERLAAHPRDDAATGDYELFLRIDASPTYATINYHFVDWTHRSVFWVDKMTTSRPIASMWHMDILQELDFWTYVDYHPMHHHLPPQAREELDAVLAFHTIDSKTFNQATAPWSPEDSHMLAKTLPDPSKPGLSMQPWLTSSTFLSAAPKSIADESDDSHRYTTPPKPFHDASEPSSSRGASRNGTMDSSSDSSETAVSERLAETTAISPALSRLSRVPVDSAATLINQPSVSVYEGCANAGVARLWMQICMCRVQNFYGDKWARLARTERRNPGDKEPPKWLRWILSLILFDRPNRFYSELQDVFVDEIVYRVHWKAFVEEQIVPEWTQNNFMATVLLAANMAFLALNDVQGADGGAFLASKILSLSSSIFSTATLFTSMSLNDFHLRLKSGTATEAMEYMKQCSTGPLGLFNIAMLYSVPFATFIWSLLTFVGAVLVFSLQHWTVAAGVPLITTTIAPVAGILVWMWWSFAKTSPKGKKEKAPPAAKGTPETLMAAGAAPYSTQPAAEKGGDRLV